MTIGSYVVLKGIGPCGNIGSMQELAPSPRWRRILNACLAGLAGVIGVDMALAWGLHFSLKGGGPATQSQLNWATMEFYFLGLVLSALLAQWQWKRSGKSNDLHEKLMTGAWLLLCILLLMRPRF